MNKDGHKEIYKAPKMVKCEACDGEGTKMYPAIYHNGDLYQDAEWLPCDVCGGKGKVPLEEENENQ